MSQALKRRLFFVWSLWVWLVWLSSGELMESRHLAGIFKNLLTPPWPHGWDAVQAACLAVAGAGAVLLAGTGMGEMLVKFVGWSGWSQGNVTPPVPLDTRNLPGPATLGRRAQLLLALAVGLPALAVLTQALGLLGLAMGSILAAVVMLPAAWALPAFRLNLRSGSPVTGSSPVLLTAVIWVAGGAVVLASFAPEVAWDAVVYPLRVPSLYLLAHKVYPIPEIFPSYFPFTGEILMMLAKNLGGDPAARTLHALVWLAGGAGIACLAKRLWGAGAAPWALALYVTIPFGMTVASRAYVEYFLVLPLIAALLILLRERGRGRSSGLILAGGLAGAAFGTKYLGGFVAVVLGVLMLKRTGFRLKPAALFTLAACGVCGIWLVRNFFWTGNPVYPVLFGGLRWTPADMAGWQDDAMAFRFDLNLLLTTPWYLLSRPGADGILSPLVLTSAAVPLLWSQSRRGPFWLLALVLFLIWWVTAPLDRYLIPTLAVFCVAAGGVMNGLDFSPVGRRWTTGLTLLGLWGSFVCGLKAIEFGTGAYDAALGKFSPREYRARFYRPPDFVQALETLEELAPPRGRVYILGYNFSYDLPRRVWIDFLFARPCLYWWLKDAPSPRRLLIRARQANLTHIAWHPPGGMAILGERPWLMDWTPTQLRTWLEFWRRHVREAGRLTNWIMYELISEARPGAQLRGVIPGTEGLVYPIEQALRNQDIQEATRLLRIATVRYPFYPVWRDYAARLPAQGALNGSGLPRTETKAYVRGAAPSSKRVGGG